MTSKLDAIRQREQRATKGPWQYDAAWVMAQERRVVVNAGDIGSSGVTSEEDGKFIAHSREDIPLLLAVEKAARKAYRLLDDTTPEQDALRRALAALDVEEQP